MWQAGESPGFRHNSECGLALGHRPFGHEPGSTGARAIVIAAIRFAIAPYVSRNLAWWRAIHNSVLGTPAGGGRYRFALDQANKTGNYTVLRDLGSPDFQANTAAQLADIFVQQRRDNIDLSGVAVIEPQLTLLPQIEANGMMHMAGFFPSVPTQMNFELLYAPVGGRWRLFGLSVSFGQAAPAAPRVRLPPPPRRQANAPAAPKANPPAPKQ